MINEIQNSFNKNGYVVIRKHLPENFADILDQHLREINSDYDAKRHKNRALQRLQLHAAPVGLFESWLAKKGKLGGQHKVPRLSNSREFMEEILAMLPQVTQ